jgi:hypothetical protein
MSLFTTAEIRWFFQEPLSAYALTWFCQPGHWLREEPRADHYLLLPSIETVGVKLRQGRLEVKASLGRPRTQRLPFQTVGQAQAWVKWSSPQSTSSDWIEEITAMHEEWVVVEKERWIRRFALEDGEPVEFEASEGFPTEGCNVELSRIRARSAPWWSLAFEAFGELPETDAILKAVATHFLHVHEPPLPLKLADSSSYPTWIQRLGPEW